MEEGANYKGQACRLGRILNDQLSKNKKAIQITCPPLAICSLKLFLMQLCTDQLQKLAAGFVLGEFTKKSRRGSYGILFLYTPHHHT